MKHRKASMAKAFWASGEACTPPDPPAPSLPPQPQCWRGDKSKPGAQNATGDRRDAVLHYNTLPTPPACPLHGSRLPLRLHSEERRSALEETACLRQTSTSQQQERKAVCLPLQSACFAHHV